MSRTFALALLILASLAPSRLHGQQIVVIANRMTSLEEISKADLRNVFLGVATRCPNGKIAVPVLLRSGQETDQFLAAYIGKVDSSFRNTWRSLVFTGQASMPKTLEDDAAVLAEVANTPGAIAYVSKASVRDSVLIVKVR